MVIISNRVDKKVQLNSIRNLNRIKYRLLEIKCRSIKENDVNSLLLFSKVQTVQTQ